MHNQQSLRSACPYVQSDQSAWADVQSDQSACPYVQSDRSLCWSLENFRTVKLLTKQHLEFLRLKGGCTGSSEATLVKMPHCHGSFVLNGGKGVIFLCLSSKGEGDIFFGALR